MGYSILPRPLSETVSSVTSLQLFKSRECFKSALFPKVLVEFLANGMVFTC